MTVFKFSREDLVNKIIDATIEQAGADAIIADWAETEYELMVDMHATDLEAFAESVGLITEEDNIIVTDD